MKNINYKLLDSFKRVSATFRRFAAFDNDNLRHYEYKYDTALTLNKDNEITQYRCIAFMRNTYTKWKDVLFDYTATINDCISKNYSLVDIENTFVMKPLAKLAKVWLIEDYSVETIQELIDKNIAAFNALQNYLNDLQLIKDLHLND